LGHVPAGVQGQTIGRALKRPHGCPKMRSRLPSRAMFAKDDRTAWFDDVELVRTAEPAMRSCCFLRSIAGGSRPMAAGGAGAALLEPARLPLPAVPTYRVVPRLRFGRQNGGGERWNCRDDEKPSENGAVPCWVFDVVIPVQDWPVGKCDLDIRLIGPDGKTLQSVRHALVAWTAISTRKRRSTNTVACWSTASRSSPSERIGGRSRPRIWRSMRGASSTA